MKLHLGCGGDLKKDYINIDIQSPFDVQHDLRKSLPYKDGSIDEIFSDDVIQMFSREEWKFVKKDWVRVLKSGGKLDIICWDFIWVLKTFIEHPEIPYNMQRIYAGQGDEWDFFKNGFTWEKLVEDFKEEGMTNFVRGPEQESSIHLICKKI